MQDESKALKPLSSDEFVERFIGAQSRVFGYIVSLAPNRADADELFQQTSLVLWRKRDQYDPQRDFIRWACGIAHNEVRNFRKKHREDRISLSDAMVERLAQLRHSSMQRLNSHLQSLGECMEKLTTQQRAMLDDCYLGNKPINVIAAENRVTPSALYKRLDRIRWALVDCMKRSERKDSRP